jgi:hypothetical protein
MIVGRKEEQQPATVKLNNNLEFKVVKSFKYLGTNLNTYNSIEEVETRILNANRCYFALNKIFRAKNISRNSKLRIYKTIIQPVILYESEAWPVTKKK